MGHRRRSCRERVLGRGTPKPVPHCLEPGKGVARGGTHGRRWPLGFPGLGVFGYRGLVGGAFPGPWAGASRLSPTIAGTVSADSAGKIVVRDEMGFQRTILTSKHTSYVEAGSSVPASAVRIGAEIVGTGAVAADHTDLDATTVQVVGPAVVGKVIGVSGRTIMVSTYSSPAGSSSAPKATKMSISTSSSTHFRRGGTSSSLRAVKAGDLLLAIGTKESGVTFAAAAVIFGSVPSGHWPVGGPPFAGGSGKPPRWIHGSPPGATATF